MVKSVAIVETMGGQEIMRCESAHGARAVIRNAANWLRRKSEASGAMFDPGAPAWSSGPLTWSYVRGFDALGEIVFVRTDSGMAAP